MSLLNLIRGREPEFSKFIDKCKKGGEVKKELNFVSFFKSIEKDKLLRKFINKIGHDIPTGIYVTVDNIKGYDVPASKSELRLDTLGFYINDRFRLKADPIDIFREKKYDIHGDSIENKKIISRIKESIKLSIESNIRDYLN